MLRLRFCHTLLHLLAVWLPRGSVLLGPCQLNCLSYRGRGLAAECKVDYKRFTCLADELVE